MHVHNICLKIAYGYQLGYSYLHFGNKIYVQIDTAPA